MTVRLDVWADIVCPWCWVGHARLARALAEEPEGSVEVVPRAFELRPGHPLEGVPTAEFYARRFGSAERARELHAHVTSEAAKEGLEMRYDRMPYAPNSRIAHRLVAIAGREGLAMPALTALFEAHFRDGVHIGDAAAASSVVAAATGLDAGVLSDAVESGDGEREVAEDEAQAAALEIAAVPCFAIVDAGIGVSGAHEPALLRKVIAAGRRQAA
jgi:predicted DsbA family dithiol-disulfide isomerase